MKGFKLPGTARDLNKFLAMINFNRRLTPNAVKNQMLLDKFIVIESRKTTKQSSTKRKAKLHWRVVKTQGRCICFHLL